MDKDILRSSGKPILPEKYHKYWRYLDEGTKMNLELRYYIPGPMMPDYVWRPEYYQTPESEKCGLMVEKTNLYKYSCSHCRKSLSLRKCLGCKRTYYCNPECQKAHWKIHKRDCLSYQQLSGGA